MAQPDAQRDKLTQLLLDAGVSTDTDDDRVFCSQVADGLIAQGFEHPAYRPVTEEDCRLVCAVVYGPGAPDGWQMENAASALEAVRNAA